MELNWIEATSEFQKYHEAMEINR